jgi:hypothetical protein
MDEIAKDMAKAFGFSTTIPAITNGFSWIIQESMGNKFEWSEVLKRHIEALEKREMSLEGEKEISMERIQRLERVLARLRVDII